MRKGIIAVIIISSLATAKAYSASFEADRAESGKVFAEFFDTKAGAAPVVAGGPALAENTVSKPLPPELAAAIKPALAVKVPRPAGKINAKRGGAGDSYFDDIANVAFEPLVAIGVIAGALENLSDAGKRVLAYDAVAARDLMDLLKRFAEKVVSVANDIAGSKGFSFVADTVSGLTNSLDTLNPFTALVMPFVPMIEVAMIGVEDLFNAAKGRPLPRKLNAEERSLLDNYFGDSLDSYAINLRMGRRGRNSYGAATAWRNNITYADMNYAGDATKLRLTYPVYFGGGLQRDGIILVHEAMHIWQNQNGISDGGKASRCRKAATAKDHRVDVAAINACYEWESDVAKGVKFADLNAEQQATFIAAYIDDTERIKSGSSAKLAESQREYGRAALELVRRGIEG